MIKNCALMFLWMVPKLELLRNGVRYRDFSTKISEDLVSVLDPNRVCTREMSPSCKLMPQASTNADRDQPLARSRGRAGTIRNSVCHAIRLSGMKANPILEEAAGFFHDHHEFSRVDSHFSSDSVPFGKYEVVMRMSDQ